MATVARSASADPFHSNRFVLVLKSGPFAVGFRDTLASFQAISLPEQSIETLEYSEGIFTYSRLYPGRSSFGTVTCSRGVVRGESGLGKWIRRTAEGWNYRATLAIHHFHREDVSGKMSYLDKNIEPSRSIILINCFPIRFKPGSDFDAMGAEISVEEIEFAVERVVIEENDKEVRP